MEQVYKTKQISDQPLVYIYFFICNRVPCYGYKEHKNQPKLDNLYSDTISASFRHTYTRPNPDNYIALAIPVSLFVTECPVMKHNYSDKFWTTI